MRLQARKIRLICNEQKPESEKERRVEQRESLLNCAPNSSRPNRNVFTRAARAFAGRGSLLLWLTGILLATTPLTQRVWSWDHFLRGGQDYESSTLLILAFLCLVLVLAQHCRQSLSLLFAARRQSSFLVPDLLPAKIALAGMFSASYMECVASPGLEMYCLPLQI